MGRQPRLSKRETSSQLQQMSIRQRQDMSGKLSNWSSLRRRVCHWRNLQHCSWEVRQSVWPSPTLRFCSPLPWCFLCLLQLLSTPLVIWSRSKIDLVIDCFQHQCSSWWSWLSKDLYSIVDFDAVLALWKAMKPLRDCLYNLNRV